jgi:hypothetical protein
VSVWHDILHPLSQNGNVFYGGVGSDLGEVTIFTGLVMLYRKHECHVEHCHWPSWHVDPAHGHPVCRRHHPDRKKGGFS